MEATFLGHEVGYETIVIDRKVEAPALSICDEPHVIDLMEDPDKAMLIFSKCDAVLPVCEELDLLETLDSMLSGEGVPLLFDLESYRISSFKTKSNEIMELMGVPLPRN